MTTLDKVAAVLDEEEITVSAAGSCSPDRTVVASLVELLVEELATTLEVVAVEVLTSLFRTLISIEGVISAVGESPANAPLLLTDVSTSDEVA